ncbi:MAG TPA: phosphate ABC transporter substrate-binding protein [Candidatus Baltobacteraceae bacterium]|nr:phosphate ABC transporter substrate-binding protein [Candidatus Baltobacteraceae bacterium]
MKNCIAIIALAAALPLAACGGNSSNSSSNSNAASNNAGSTSGAAATITAAGSTALLPLVKQAAQDYQAKHPNVKISVSGGGSMVGITQSAQKAVDIGDSDVPAANQPSLVDHQVAVVTFGVVVNPKTGVKNLSIQQIRDIFSGKTKNFSQLGGADQQITIINRPRSSGTRAVFVKNIMGGQQPTESGLTQDSSGTVATMVAQTPGAISYLAMSYVKPGQQQAVWINGVAPSDANVESGKYPYWSYEHMFTNGQSSAQVADFINFVKNDTSLLRQLGFIPVSAMKAGAK